MDFDKEIDAMLRKAQRDAPVLVGDFASSRHLDADEISAFAENAMPEKSRALQMAHLADCNRCRKILSDVLVMNSEASPAVASPGVITIAERAPWYRRLFLFPNLAYVMSSLVLIFSAFLGYTIYQRSSNGQMAISQATAPAETKGGPNFQEQSPLEYGEAAASNSAANSMANTSVATNGGSSNSNALVGRATERGPMDAGRAPENNFTLDGVDSGQPLAAAPPPPTATKPSLAEPSARDDAAKEKTENKISVDVTTGDIAKRDSTVSNQQQYQLPSAGASQSGPMRNNENQYNRQLESLNRKRAAAEKSAIRDEENSSGTRSVGGKVFERKQRVWYDVSYQSSRPTINVRRGSAEFNKLDSGLKSIANALSGTAVIVWGAKAYRIQ